MTWVYSWSSELLPFCIKLQLQYWNPSSLVHLLWLQYLHSSTLVHLRFVLQNHNGECCRKTAEKSDWHPDFQSFQVPLYVALQKSENHFRMAPWWLSFALVLSAFLLWKLNLFISAVSKCARNVQQCDTGISNNQQEIKQKQHIKKLAQLSGVRKHYFGKNSVAVLQKIWCQMKTYKGMSDKLWFPQIRTHKGCGPRMHHSFERDKKSYSFHRNNWFHVQYCDECHNQGASQIWGSKLSS